MSLPLKELLLLCSGSCCCCVQGAHTSWLHCNLLSLYCQILSFSPHPIIIILCFVFEMGSGCVAQVGLELLGSSDWAAGTKAGTTKPGLNNTLMLIVYSLIKHIFILNVYPGPDLGAFIYILYNFMHDKLWGALNLGVVWGIGVWRELGHSEQSSCHCHAAHESGRMCTPQDGGYVSVLCRPCWVIYYPSPLSFQYGWIYIP